MSTLMANEPSDLAFDEVKAADLVIMSGDEAAQVDLVSLISKRDWQHVIDRLKDSPHEARRKHVMTLDGIETTCYPLHLSVSKKPPLHVVEAMIDGYPDAIKSRDEKSGRLPLHIACIHTAAAPILRLLTERYEESLRITDTAYGRLPLHFACLYGSPFDIALLVTAEPRALVFKDSNGKTPKDLAEDSTNPHREAIMLRLEDRTRIVTENLILRRKQLSTVPLETQKGRVGSRKEKNLRSDGGMLPEDVQTIYRSNRRAKSLEKLDVLTESKIVTTRTKSMALGHSSGHEKTRRSSRVAKALVNMEDLSSSQALDDSYMGKLGKSSRRHRDENKTLRQKMDRRPSDPISGYHSRKRSDALDVTPKQSNSRSLAAALEGNNNSGKAISDGVSHRKLERTRSAKLSRFLQLQELNNSDDESDLKSMGVRSLPPLVHTTIPKQKQFQAPDDNLVIKEFMFQDSSDDMDSPVIVDGGEPALDTEIVTVTERLRNLDIRREALSQECEAINATIAKKEEDAMRSREVIKDIKLRLIELQEKLEREQVSLSLAETGIQLQKETLAVHEIKIRAVDSEKAEATAHKEKLEEQSKSSTGNS